MIDQNDRDPDLQVVEAIYDALDREEPATALRLADEARSQSEVDDPVVIFLAGIALLELDRPAQAVERLQQATLLDPEDAEFRSSLALALFRCCRFDEAEKQIHRALEFDAHLPDSIYVLALLLERSSSFAESDHHFERAAKLDPERFSKPHHMAVRDFEAHIARARATLSEEFIHHLDRVVVTIEELPSDAILFDETPPLDPELFGLFVGVPLTENSSFSGGGELPPRILLFKRNLERFFPDTEELTRQIAVTLYHELGHYLGMDEENLEAIELL